VKKKDKAAILKMNGSSHVFCVEHGKSPFLIRLDNQAKVMVRRKEQVTRWDYVATFKPPAYLSIENGRIFSVDKLNQGSPDYDFVANLFKTTYGNGNGGLFGGNPIPPRGGVIFGRPIANPMAGG
jgi:hypothetical protein